MKTVGYKNWGLIAHDEDPATAVRLSSSPPMMSVVAVDPNGSLVFELGAESRELLFKAEATAMSAEPIEEEVFSVYTGAAEDSLRPVQGLSWEKTNEGMYTVFSTRIEVLGPFVKLFYSQEGTLVLNQVTFQIEE